MPTETEYSLPGTRVSLIGTSSQLNGTGSSPNGIGPSVNANASSFTGTVSSLLRFLLFVYRRWAFLNCLRSQHSPLRGFRTMFNNFQFTHICSEVYVLISGTHDPYNFNMLGLYLHTVVCIRKLVYSLWRFHNCLFISITSRHRRFPVVKYQGQRYVITNILRIYYKGFRSCTLCMHHFCCERQ